MKLNTLSASIMAALAGTPTLWAGDQASFDVVVKAQQMTEEAMRAGTLQRDADGIPLGWEKQGDTAIINVTGSLVDGSAGWGRFFGMMGYDDVINAAIGAYGDPEVERVMWRIDSPGGSVAGVIDCGNTISQLSATKPSAVFTPNKLASAAYWLGTSVQGPIIAGPTAEVGSVGVMMPLNNVAKQLDMQGVKVEIMRSGEQKTRINPIEPLTDKARADLQGRMDDVHDLFNAQVAKGRPNLSADDLAKVTDGSVFLGKRAKALGLVDNVASFEQALKLLDKQKLQSNTPPNSKGAHMKLSQDTVLKLISGVPVAQLGLNAEETVEAEQLLASMKAEADAAAALAANEAAAATAAAAAAAAAKDGIGGAAQANDLLAANAKIDLLSSQLQSANSELITAKSELKTLQDATAPMKADNDALLEIARSSVGRMQVAMGASDTAVGFDAKTAIAEHARLNEAFMTKFKVGGAAVTASETLEDAKKVVPDEATRNFMRAAAAQQERLAGKQ